MKRFLAAALFALLSATAQHSGAQAESWRWSAPHQRKIVIAALKAATDCIAERSRTHPDILEAYRNRNLRSIIETVWPLCASEIDRLSREYANLNGWGAGYAFIDGPYKDDLPRAVLARIGGELDRRALEAQQGQENAQRTADLLRDRMYGCTRGELAKLAPSTETAEVLTSAALTICRQHVTDFIEAQLGALRMKFPNVTSETEDRDYRARLARTIREWVLADAVRARAEQNTAPRRSNPEAKPGGVPNDRLGNALVACLEVVSDAQKDKISSNQRLVEMMAELCRPEIEGLARGMFLADTSVPLDRARERALKFALEQASRMVGVRRRV